jgi:hypothetical protein
VITVKRALHLPGTPAAVAFNYLADLRNLREWDPCVVTVRPATKTGLSVGSTFQVSARPLFRQLDFLYRIAELEPITRIVFTREGASFHAIDQIDVDAEAAGARLRYESTLDLSGTMRLAQPVLKRRFRFKVSRAVNRLAVALLRQRPPQREFGFHGITW